MCAADAGLRRANLEVDCRVAEAVQVEQRVSPDADARQLTAVLGRDADQVRHGEDRQLRNGVADAREHVLGDLQRVQLVLRLLREQELGPVQPVAERELGRVSLELWS